MLSNREKERYSRHLSLPDFGPKEQQKLKSARVLVVGCGGLGSPVLLYLAGAGVGTLGLVDDDEVDLSNLQRQIIFKEHDLGESKARKAAQRICNYNSDIAVKVYEVRLDSRNIMDIARDYDVIVDGTDNFPTRYLLNDAAILLDKILVHGSIYRYEGQVCVFNVPYHEGRSANYRDLFPEPPPPELETSCAAGGVLGVLPGMVGSIMANEVIKIITGNGDILYNKLLLIDAHATDFRKIGIKKNPNNPLTGERPVQSALIDYELFCGRNIVTQKISVEKLKNWMEENLNYTLIDVREPTEYHLDNLGGIHVPLKYVESRSSIIPQNGKVVIMCQSGERSHKAIQILKDKHGFSNLINLEGGLNAYRRHFPK